jgi:spermidine synthase
VSGLAITLLEFAAVRFMAPSFGQSNYVWANVIGVILLALSLGYWLGGRLADRSETGRSLYVAYVLAAAWVVGIAWLGGPLCEWLVPRAVGNARLLPLAFTGSLVATVLLFGPPTLVLGMTSPFLIRLDHREGSTGSTAGRVFAVGTLGSLVGCYLGPLWLFQAVGSRATILLCAAALAALGLAGLVLGARQAKRAAAAAALVCVGALGLAGYTAAAEVPLRVHAGQLAELESGYQSVRVVEAEEPALEPAAYPMYGREVSVPVRFLRHDEDSETYQSVWLPEDTERLLTGGRYYEHLALGAWFDRPVAPATLRVLVVGYAGGTVHRMLRLTKPEGVRLQVLGVEIDPGVVEAARRWLDLAALEGEELELVTGEDARTVVNALPDDRRFDLILVDAYTRTTYVPFQVASVEFFDRAARHLAPGGWIGVNLHSNGGLQGRLLRALATTMGAAEHLGDVWLTPNPLFPGSLVLWAAAPGRGAPRLRGDVPLSLLTPSFALERLTVRFDPKLAKSHVLTDDLSDVDRLTDAELTSR